MSRSPLAYPLNRGIDGDAGGAADLQTDIMRFMAILALCLVAIFALVQSIPLAPQSPPAEPAPAPVQEVQAKPAPAPVADSEPAPQSAEVVQLTRPKWQPRPKPERVEPVAPVTPAPTPLVRQPAPAAPPESPPAEQPVGFTLRFESDLALTRLVAANQVGFYAIADGRAQRMAVSDSRISFWNASTPNAFHEMEATTVPEPVTQALQRSGTESNGVNWGVTLPGKLSRQLDTLMRENDGGSLVIGVDGQLRLEAK